MPGQQGILAKLEGSVWEGGADDCSRSATPPGRGGEALLNQAVPCMTERWSFASCRERLFSAASSVTKQLSYMELG